MSGDIYWATKYILSLCYTDLCKYIDGICALVENELHMNPLHSALCFCVAEDVNVSRFLGKTDDFVSLTNNLLFMKGIASHAISQKYSL